MTDYTIPMIIGMTLAFTLGAAVGALWGLSRHEWLYCRVTAHLAWRMREAMKSLGIDAVDEDGTIRRKLVHDMREHTVSKAPCPQQPENIRTLAENIIKFNFRFLKDFDMSEWD